MLERIVLYWSDGLWWRWRSQPQAAAQAVSPRVNHERTAEAAPAPRPRKGGGSLASLEASCHPIASAKDEPWPAQVRELTAGGIGLMIKRRFEPGTLLAVELQSSTTDFSRTLVARVIHAKSQGGGDWVIGCILASKLDEEELESLRL